MDQFHLYEIIGVTLIFVAAGFVKGVIGFGLPLVAMSLLSSVIPVDVALALLVLPIVSTNLWQGLQGGYFMAIARRFWSMIAMLGVGIFVGASIVAGIDDRTLFLVIGMAIVVFVGFSVWQPRFVLDDKTVRWLSPIVGFLSGVIGGISTIYGPPMLIVLTSLRLPKDFFVAAVGVVLFSGSIFLTIAFSSVKILTADLVLPSALSALPVFAGMYAGRVLRNRIPQEGFRRVILLSLFLISLNLIRRAIF
jgi:hypothetical protein